MAIKTPSRSFNHLFYFGLNASHRICVKPIAPGTGLRDGWQLLNGDGLPDDHARAERGPDAFAVPRWIVAIHADADEIFALSDELRSYSMRWLPNPVFSGNEKHWNDKIGWPLEEPYFVTKTGSISLTPACLLTRATRSVARAAELS